MLGKKVKVSKELWDKIVKASELAMCTTPDEWAGQILESQADKLLREAGKDEVSQEDIDDIARKMQGLGYLE